MFAAMRMISLAVAVLAIGLAAVSATAKATPGWGPLTTLVTDTRNGLANDQQVGVAPHGAAFVLWSEEIGKREAILAVRGSTQSGFAVAPGQPPQTLSRTSWTSAPHVAFRPDGSAIAVWQTNRGILVARASAGGEFGSPARIPERYDLRAVAFTRRGRVIVILEGRHRFWLRTIEATRAAARARPISAPAGTLGAASIALAGNSAVLVWDRQTDSARQRRGRSYVESRTLLADGKLTRTQRLASAPNARRFDEDVQDFIEVESLKHSQAAADAHGTVTAIWWSAGGIRWASKPRGRPFSAARQLSHGGSPQGPTSTAIDTSELPATPMLSVAADGRAAAIWIDDALCRGAASVIRVAIRRPGRGFGAAQTLARERTERRCSEFSGVVAHPNVTWTAAGAVAAWSVDDVFYAATAGPHGRFAKRTRLASGNFPNTLAQDALPAIAADARGNALVAFPDATDAGDETIAARIYHAG